MINQSAKGYRFITLKQLNLTGLYQGACITSLAFCLSACAWLKPADERVSETREIISQSYRDEVYRQSTKTNLGELDISWKEGLNKMYLSNPEVIQADYRIEDAVASQKQIWKDFIPSAVLGVSDSFELGELGDAFSNPVYRINSFLNLGNLLDLPQDLYTRKLTRMGAELNAENTMRQQVIALYRLFQEQKLLRLQKEAIDHEAELLKGITGIDGSEILQMKLDHQRAFEDWETREQDWNTRVGDFFIAGYGSINLQANSLPDITYDPETIDFADTTRWGMLQLNLLALEKIAEDGNLLDVYLRYLPRANLNVSAPPIFSNSSNSSFRASDIRLNPSVFWSLDTRGTIGRQIRRLKRSAPITQWRRDKRQRDEVKRLIEGKEALKNTQYEISRLREAVAGYREAVLQGLIKDPQKAIATLRLLREREVRLLANEIEICTAFWLIDESRWKTITQQWLDTREDRANIRNKQEEKKGKKFFGFR